MKRKALIFLVCILILPVPVVIAQPCEGNFDCDQDVDGSDAAVFKEDFGRSPFKNPCPNCPSPALVPRTGQTTAYYEGDYGDLEKGVVWPEPRFTDNENGTVNDNLTGLIWLKDANCFGIRTWNEALTDCNSLAAGDNLCNSGIFSLTDGSSGGDWRLPNLFELESLRDVRYWEPALSNSAGTGQWTYGDPFINLLPNGFYWSSTTHANYTISAWYVDMVDGYVNTFSKAIGNYVWPVRGGQ